VKEKLQAMAVRVVRLAQQKEDLERERNLLRDQLAACRRRLVPR